jgi:hypothetical protein
VYKSLRARSDIEALHRLWAQRSGNRAMDGVVTSGATRDYCAIASAFGEE